MAADLSLVHLLTALGRHLLVDGTTGALAGLTADDYDAWQRWLASKPTPEDRRSVAVEAGGPPHLAELLESGLFGTPAYPPSSPDSTASGLGRADSGPPDLGAPPQNGLHSLCLNVAHACNLSCRYCFASQGGYETGERTLMSPGTARGSIDFLLAHARPGRSISVDFFGGEPLLAWDTVVETVGYGRERAGAAGVVLEFTITTNGTLVDSARARFLAAEMSTVIVSVDGRPGVHDRMRPNAAGGPSYDSSIAGAELIAGAICEADAPAPLRPGSGGSGPPKTAETMPQDSGRMWVRGTFTRHNLDFWRDAVHLAEKGFRQISIEPATGNARAPWAIGPSHLASVRSSYEQLARMVVEGRFRFFHFELNRQRPACAVKRFSGCGAGVHYACVSPDGSVFPCHQFDGMKEYRLGMLRGSRAASGPPGGTDGLPLLPDPRFAGCHIGKMPSCRYCWAQLYCGGGCRHAAATAGGGLCSPPVLYCRLLRLRLEAALGVAAATAIPRA